jgi:hypothetical protein
MRKHALLVWISLITTLGVFLYFYASSQTNVALATASPLSPHIFPVPRDHVLKRRLDAEALQYLAGRHEVLDGNDKGSLLVTPAIRGQVARKSGGKATSARTYVIFGGSGHDVVEMGQDGVYARLGDGSDHVVIHPGEVKAGETKIIRGDEGWDTAVLGTGMSLQNVVKRTSPYKIIDPVTQGMYELDVEALGVVDNLTADDTRGFADDLVATPREPAAQPTRIASVPYPASGSLHYSKSIVALGASHVYGYDARMAPVLAARMQDRQAAAGQEAGRRGKRAAAAPLPMTPENLGLIPLAEPSDGRSRTRSPFGTWPAILSIEGGFFAVGSREPLDESTLRDNVASATLSLSTTSLGDCAARIRLLTERELTLHGDIADPVAVQDVFDQLVAAKLVTAVTWRKDRHVDVTLPRGGVLTLKPSFLVSRLSWWFPQPYVMRVEDAQGRLAFAVIGRDGIAQTFVSLQPAAEEDPIAAGITRGVLADLRAVEEVTSTVQAPEDLVPQTTSRITRYPKRGDDQYPLRVEADGGVFYVMSETPIEQGSEQARVMAVQISISSLFYARRTVHLYLSNGDRIFARASLANPEKTLQRMERAVAEGEIKSLRLTKELLGPLNIGFKTGKYGKMMPLLFGARTGRRPHAPLLQEVLDGRGGRFSFVVIDPDGYAQTSVDIGGSTILPALPKP